MINFLVSIRDNWKPATSGLVVGIPIGGMLATSPVGNVFLAVWDFVISILKLASALL